jgi:macrolide transport system ATP-binding/permease protein
MTIWRKLRLLMPSARREADRDIQEELASLEAIAGRGQLGNLTLVAEDARGEMTWPSLERLGQDLRYGLRSIKRDKLFALLAVASLALGIGANTAIYSFLDSVLLRPLPVADPESLVVMKWRAKGYALASRGMSWSTGGSTRDPETGTLSSIFPYPALTFFQAQEDVLTSAFGYFVNRNLSVTVGSNTDSLLGHYVSGHYFHGMGVAPAAGRLIQPSDDTAEPAAVAVVSDRFSRRQFGDAHAALGQTIRVNDEALTIVGVTPAAFFGAEPGAIPDVYLPLHASPMRSRATDTEEHFYWLEVMGRLKPGVTLAQAQARLGPAFLQFVIGTADTERQKQDLPQLTLQEGVTGLDSLRRKYAQPIYVLMAMVGSILFIACANIANLLLARSAARRREIAIRLSVGASRWRVIRQLLTESLLLSGIGGVLGVALAWWGIQVLTALLANGRENFTLHAELSWSVLAVTIVLSVLTGVLFGLVPALQATRVDIAPALKDVRARDTPRVSRRIGLGGALVVTQMALSLLLLVAAGLFDRTLASLHDIPLGFNRERLLLFTIRPSTIGYQGPAALRLFETVRERLHGLPGVRDVGLSVVPLPTGGGTTTSVAILGAPDAAVVATPPETVISVVGPDFFKTMQIPIVAGREFTGRDDGDAPRIAVVNRRFAAAFGVQNPVGRNMTIGKDRYQIVGMVENALTFNLKEDGRPAAYFSYLQGASSDARAPSQMTYQIRTAGDPLDLAGPVRAIVREADLRLAIHGMKTQAEHIDQGISTEITLAKLCSLFAVLALVIACVGLYGTVAFNVARRTTEIGIRSALGASAGRIVWMILRDVCLMAAVGLAIGIPLVLAGSRYVKSFLYGVTPTDPVAIALAIGILLTAGLLAGYVPARRASRIDPLGAMRSE